MKKRSRKKLRLSKETLQVITGGLPDDNQKKLPTNDGGTQTPSLEDFCTWCSICQYG